MTLLDLCEPLFERICFYNRQVRAGRNPEYSQMRPEVEGLFKDLRAGAATDPGLQEQYANIELALVFFVDSMIAEMPIPAAENWHKNRLAYDRNELAGDEKFFDLLDQALADRSTASQGRLSVYYVCMGLGFAGFYAHNPEYIRKKMLDCAAQMGDQVDANQMARICPEAYEHVDTRDMVQPPGSKLLGIFLLLVGLIVVLFVANIYLFRDAYAETSQTVEQIIEQELGARRADAEFAPPPRPALQAPSRIRGVSDPKPPKPPEPTSSVGGPATQEEGDTTP